MLKATNAPGCVVVSEDTRYESTIDRAKRETPDYPPSTVERAETVTRKT